MMVSLKYLVSSCGGRCREHGTALSLLRGSALVSKHIPSVAQMLRWSGLHVNTKTRTIGMTTFTPMVHMCFVQVPLTDERGIAAENRSTTRAEMEPNNRCLKYRSKAVRSCDTL